MDKVVIELRSAAEALKTVANGLHVQLDLSSFNKALEAFEDAVAKKPAVKPTPRAE